HYRALLSLGQALVDENKPGAALRYLERATQSEPFSWRPYALSAHAYLSQGSLEQAAAQARRAIELGNQEAAVAQRYLAAALSKLGEKDKAVNILQGYIRTHPDDISAKKQLERLQESKGQNPVIPAQTSAEELLQSDAIAAVTPPPLSATMWVPPD